MPRDFSFVTLKLGLAIFFRRSNKKYLRDMCCAQDRLREWLARGGIFFSFRDYIGRWLIDPRRRVATGTTGDDVNKFSPGERVRSLARCEGRLRRQRSEAQKRRRFMLPRTLPAVIIGAFISTTTTTTIFFSRFSSCPFHRLSLCSFLCLSFFSLLFLSNKFPRRVRKFFFFLQCFPK